MLKKKVAVITGGSRGIGKEICKKFAENGADIALIYAGNVEKAEEVVSSLLQYKVKSKAYRCNIADFEETTKTFSQILKDFLTIDILVNNAGITRDRLVLSLTEKDFNDVIDVNLKGVYHTIKQVYPVFMKKRSGKIINLSSVSGLIGNPGQANYSASKAGVIGITKSVAKELASRGVCCNAIAPGFIKTDMTENFINNKTIIESIPAKRAGFPEEVAELALFLASEKSNYITGEVIRIDGGLAM
ncbi:MAG: 3-oxoacyl-[acyl-carrier-protein] reductase [Clostridiales bacterium]|nr:3-oxoacyl-[acyl-carrier-protein] reductase [Clostridiales bacterium]